MEVKQASGMFYEYPTSLVRGEKRRYTMSRRVVFVGLLVLSLALFVG